MASGQIGLSCTESGAQTPAHAVPEHGAAHLFAGDGGDADHSVRVRERLRQNDAGNGADAFPEQLPNAITAAEPAFPG